MVGFPSGQREQTVNLPAKPSKVQILPPPFFSGPDGPFFVPTNSRDRRHEESQPDIDILFCTVSGSDSALS